MNYRKRDDENLYYICPRYWCIDKNISLRHEDVVKDGDKFTSKKCPSGNIISYDHSLYHYRKNDKNKYVNTYPGLNLKKSNIPCCFKNPRKDVPPINNNDEGNDKKEEIINNDGNVMMAKQEQNKELIEKSKNVRILEYNKFPLPEFRYGFLPLNVKLMLNIKNDNCIDVNSSCLLRFGTVSDDKNSFLHVMYLYYVFRNDSKRITEQVKNTLKTPNDFIKEIVNNWLNIDDFLNFQNGSLIEFFDYETKNTNKENNDDEVSYDDSILKDSVILNTITDKNGNIDENMKTKILRSFQNYKNYLLNENIDYKYTWELFTNKLNQVDKSKTNIIIIEIDGFELESPCRIICPYNYTKQKTFNSRKHSVILLKYGNKYEALIQRERYGESKYYNKVFFNEKEKSLQLFLSKIENIYNNNEFCGKYMTNQLFLDNFKNFNEINPNMMQKFLDENNFQIKQYIVNYNTKLCGFVVNHNNYNDDFFIPVHQSGIEESRKNLKNRKYVLLNFVSEYLDLYNTLSIFHFIHSLQSDIAYKPQYFVCENNYVVGIQLENSLIVPILPHIPKKNIDNDLMLDCVKNNYIYIDNNEIYHYDGIINNKTTKTTSSNDILLDNISETSKNYNIYRSHIKSNINHIENRNEKNEIQSLIITANDENYSATINKLIELIKKIGVTQREKINFIRNEEMDLYPYLLSDELLRYYRIRNYLFIDNKYILFGEKYNLSKENELFISHGSLDTLNEELIDKNLNKNNRSIYATSNPEYNRPIKYDDGFNILDYVPNNQKPFLFENSILNNDESNKSKQNKTKKKRSKCPNGTRKNKESGLCVNV